MDDSAALPAVVHTRCRFGIAAPARARIVTSLIELPQGRRATVPERMRRRAPAPVATHQWPNAWLVVGVVFAPAFAR